MLYLRVKETEMEKNTQKGAKADILKKKTPVQKKTAPKVKRVYLKVQCKKTAILKAMRSNLGNISKTCEELKIGRTTYYEYYNQDEEFKKNIDSIAEDALDFVESKLFERIKGYSHPEDKIFVYEGLPITVPTTKHFAPDTTAIIFYLKTRGKERGYIERQEIINKNAPIDPFEGKTEAEIDEMLREVEQEDRQEKNKVREFKTIEEDPENDNIRS